MIKENIAEFEQANILKYQQMPIKKDVGAIVILDSNNKPRIHDNIEIAVDYFWKAEEDGHNTWVCGVARQVAPDARIISFNYFWPSKKNIIDWIIEHKDEIAVVNCSFTTNNREIERLKEHDIIVIAATGNNSKESLYPASLDWVIDAGAFSQKTQKVPYYSSDTDDIVSFTNIHIKKDNGELESISGTSASCPVAVGMLWLYMSRAGVKFNREQARAFIWRNTVDLYEKGHDERSGYGLFRLPNEIERSTPMFNDIETRSEEAKQAIEWAAREGLVKGNTDGTFAPTEPVTREQLAIILKRLYN